MVHSLCRYTTTLRCRSIPRVLVIDPRCLEFCYHMQCFVTTRRHHTRSDISSAAGASFPHQLLYHALGFCPNAVYALSSIDILQIPCVGSVCHGIPGISSRVVL
ncbi:hypothetical protein Tco_0344510 [Tanacetum coccineum]